MAKKGLVLASSLNAPRRRVTIGLEPHPSLPALLRFVRLAAAPEREEIPDALARPGPPPVIPPAPSSAYFPHAAPSSWHSSSHKLSAPPTSPSLHRTATSAARTSLEYSLRARVSRRARAAATSPASNAANAACAAQRSERFFSRLPKNASAARS